MSDIHQHVYIIPWSDKHEILVCIRDDGYVSLIGGEIEVGETAESALKREFNEETGGVLSLDKCVYQSCYDMDVRGWKTKNFIYSLRVESIDELLHLYFPGSELLSLFRLPFPLPDMPKFKYNGCRRAWHEMPYSYGTKEWISNFIYVLGWKKYE